MNLMANRPDRVLGRIGRAARRVPFSLVLLSVALGLEVATGQSHALHTWLRQHFAVSWPDLRNFELHRLALSPLLQTRPGIVGTIVWLLCVFLPWLEWRLGSRLAAAVFFLGDWLSTAPVLAALAVADRFGVSGAGPLAAARDSGSSAGALAAAAAIAASYRGRTRLVLLLVVFAFLGLRLALVGRMYDYQHLVAAGVGAGISAVATRGSASSACATWKSGAQRAPLH